MLSFRPGKFCKSFFAFSCSGTTTTLRTLKNRGSDFGKLSSPNHVQLSASRQRALSCGLARLSKRPQSEFFVQQTGLGPAHNYVLTGFSMDFRKARIHGSASRKQQGFVFLSCNCRWIGEGGYVSFRLILFSSGVHMKKATNRFDR